MLIVKIYLHKYVFRTTPLGMQARILGACPKPGWSGRIAASDIKMDGWWRWVIG